MDIVEIEQKEKVSRKEAAARLRKLATMLAKGNEVKFEQGGMSMTVYVPDEVELKVELEVDTDERESSSSRTGEGRRRHPPRVIVRSAGKAAREHAPRSSHGEWKPASDRPDPVDVLQGQAEDRVADLIPLRYGRMLVSAFTFYRGAAAIMAADLAATPNSGFWVQACGDAHLSNFGGYGSPDRGMVVDINDFDETLPGPWEWDVKRLAASFEIAGRDRGFKAAQRRKVTLAAVEAYRESMRRLAELSNLDVWYRRVDVTEIRDHLEAAVSEKELKKFDKNVAKARRKDRLRAFSKLTERVDGELRIRSDPPVLVPRSELFSGKQLKAAEGDRHSPRGRIPGNAPGGPPAPARRLPAGRRCAQGSWRRQRRDQGVDSASDRPRRE